MPQSSVPITSLVFSWKVQSKGIDTSVNTIREQHEQIKRYAELLSISFLLSRRYTGRTEVTRISLVLKKVLPEKMIIDWNDPNPHSIVLFR